MAWSQQFRLTPDQDSQSLVQERIRKTWLRPPLVCWTSDYYKKQEVVPDLEFRCRLQQDSAFFIRTRSQKFVKNRNRIRGHFSISAAAGVFVVIFSVKTWENFGCIDDCSWSLHRSRILKFEKLLDPEPDQDSKILKQERSRRLKKWLRPPLVTTVLPDVTLILNE